MSTITDTELLTNLTEDVTVSCEHPEHPLDPRLHEDGNEHYVRIVAPCGCADPNELHIACWKWIEVCSQGMGMICGKCGEVQPFHIANKVVGPVKGYLK